MQALPRPTDTEQVRLDQGDVAEIGPNKALIKRLNDLETVNSTPRESTQLQSDVPTLSAQNNLHSLTSMHENGLQLTAPDIQLNTTQLQPPQANMTTSQLNSATTLL